MKARVVSNDFYLSQVILALMYGVWVEWFENKIMSESETTRIYDNFLLFLLGGGYHYILWISIL